MIDEYETEGFLLDSDELEDDEETVEGAESLEEDEDEAITEIPAFEEEEE